jgi:hypothetical protein
MDSQREVQPTFQQAYFMFENPDLIPPHYDEAPLVPNFVGLWTIFGWSGGNKITTTFATDVNSQDQAAFLARAKKDYLEATIEMYRYTPDIYILSPTGEHARLYMGRNI